jgi:hypothetical protein
MIAPPKPPSHDELEALIKEARARQLRRRLLGVAGVAIAAALGFSVHALVGAPGKLVQPPASAGRAISPPCRASQLSVSAALQGATQSLAGEATITNTGGSPCSLPRLRPIIRMSSKGQALPVGDVPFTNRIVGHGRPVRILGAGAHAVIFIQWWDWCGKTGVTTMAVQLGRRVELVAPQRFGEPTCIQEQLSTESFMYVSPPFHSAS